MRRVVGLILVVGLLGTGALGAWAQTAKRSRLTVCTAVTRVQAQKGVALFRGTCNGASKSAVKADPYKVTGKVGGLGLHFKRSGLTLTGRLGERNARFTYRGRTFRGHYGPHAVKFTVGGDRFTVAGRVGPMRVVCTVKPLLPLGERITCKGRRGGAAVMFPFLALLYAAY